jgi:alanine dehydrogenase
MEMAKDQWTKGPTEALPFLDAAACRASLPYKALVAALRSAFCAPHHAPDRHIHDLHVPQAPEATALLMPAWVEGDVYGVKLANIFPGNGLAGQPAINAIYVLFSALTGKPLAMMDGTEITVRRTVATSALAASYLSRIDSRRLLIIGTGRLSSQIAEAYLAVRPIEQVTIWGRDPSKAASVCRAVEAATGVPARPARDLAAEVEAADIVSCATLSTTPILRGSWLQPGVHVDLIGAFKPSMRETDDAAVRACDVYIDTLSGAKAEAGDLIQAEAAGAFTWAGVKADLQQLCSGERPGRTDDGRRTLFKSVGAAIEDLAAARLVAQAQNHTTGE